MTAGAERDSSLAHIPTATKEAVELATLKRVFWLNNHYLLDAKIG